MQYGTIAFYQAVSALMPLALLTYIFSLRVFPTIKEFRKEPTAHRRPYVGDAMRFLVTIAPLFAGLGAIGAEAACLHALYRGVPTSGDSGWTISGLNLMIVAYGAHLSASGFLALGRFLDSKDEAS